MTSGMTGGDSVSTASSGVKIQSDTLKCFKIVDEKLHWNDQALEVRTVTKFVDVRIFFLFSMNAFLCYRY